MSIIKSCTFKTETLHLGMPGEHTITQVYQVETTARAAASAVALEVFDATPDPVPRMLSPMAYDTYVTGIDVAPISDTNATTFRVTLNAGKLPDGQDPNTPAGDNGVINPLLAKTVFYAESLTVSELITRDRDGKPLVNSAGLEFDEALVEDDEIPVIVFEKNYASYQEIMAVNEAYRRTHNGKPFMGFPSETCKFLSMQASRPQYFNGLVYFTGVGRIAVRKEGWIRYLVDQGSQYWDKPKTEAGARLINAVDENGQLANGNVLLKSDGTRLPQGEIGHGIGFYILKNADYDALVANP